MFVGFVPLGDDLIFAFTVRNSGRQPSEPDDDPSYRVYGAGSLIESATGTAEKLDITAITGASNQVPIVVTAAGHGMSTGDRASISGVLGNTAANGTWTVTVIDADTFSLDGSSGNGAYTSGGESHVTGLYNATIGATAAAGFEVNGLYTVHITYTLGGGTFAEQFSFQVV